MRILTGGLLLLLAPAAYAEKLCIAPFSGPGGSAVRSQIADNLCTTNACVDPKKATKGGKPDFAKGKKEKVDFFVTGAVKAKGAKHTLDVQVLSKPGSPKLKKSFPYTGNALPDKTLDSVLAALNKAMGLEEAPPPKEEPKKEEAKKEEEPKKEEPAPAEPKKEEAKEEPKKKKEPEPPPPPPKEEERKAEDEPAPRKPVKPSFVALEAGIELFSRNFSYNTPDTNNLRSYSASLIVAPIVKAELYPLALFSKGFISGLGFDGSFAIAVGLKSRRSGTDVTWPTSLQHFDFSLRFRIMPFDSVAAEITPFVGYAMRTFSVGTGTDGSTLDGLPAIAYSGIRPGLAGELPFSNSGLSVFAKFAVIVVLSSGQIISAADTGFFKKGSNLGLEGQLGIGYRIFGPLGIRAAFDFTRYGLSFASEPTDTYRAGGAVDIYLGGTITVRLTF